MTRDRSFIIVVIIILLVVAAFLIWRRNTGGLFRQPPPAEVPLDLSNVIPADWDTQPEWQLQCDFDNDTEQEWLIVYRYDRTDVPQSYPSPDSTTSRSPVGAAIFDTQNNPVPEGGGNPSPYQPTFVIPYRLLPDFYAGKGQGYLGESNISIVYDPPVVEGPECRVNEITVLGYADGSNDLPTRLSIFRWKDPETGYIGEHFVGDERIAADIPTGERNQGSQVTTVTTYNRLSNHRSLLCAVRTYNRDTSQDLHFDENENVYTIDFCFGSPADPTYPEGVVVAYLRGLQPAPRSTDAPTVPTDSYLLNGVAIPAGIVTDPPMRIFSLTNLASIGSHPTGGHVCTPAEIDVPTPPEGSTPTPDQGWICGRVDTTVETEVVFPDRVRRVVWELTSLNPEQVNGDIHWRIKDIQVVTSP